MHLLTPWCCPEPTEAPSQRDCPGASGFSPPDSRSPPHGPRASALHTWLSRPLTSDPPPPVLSTPGQTSPCLSFRTCKIGTMVASTSQGKALLAWHGVSVSLLELSCFHWSESVTGICLRSHSQEVIGQALLPGLAPIMLLGQWCCPCATPVAFTPPVSHLPTDIHPIPPPQAVHIHGFS